MLSNLSASLGSFLRALAAEMLNAGLTFETFTENCLKQENTTDLLDYYQTVKDILEDLISVQQELTKSNKCWREHAKFYSELAKIVDLIPYSLLPNFFMQL